MTSLLIKTWCRPQKSKKAISALVAQGYDEEDAEWYVLGMLAREQDEEDE
jgi:hypothetical protein